MSIRGFLPFALACVIHQAVVADALQSQAGQVTHLFNGRDLDGFYTFIQRRGRDNDPKKVFTVADGMIRISGEEFGCITTRDEYENYRLVAEYKWGERTWPPRQDCARDSGILLHSVGRDGGYAGVWMPSIECQLIEGGTGDVLAVNDASDRIAVTCPVAPEKQGECNVYDPKGKPATITSGRINWFGRDPDWKDVKGFRGRRDVERPVGEWNRIECIAEGSTITIILNGVVVNRCIDVRPRKGRIQIQSEGAEIFFRRLDLAGARMIIVDGSDSSAIAAAIDRSEPGDTVYLPPGKYTIRQTIRPKSGTLLRGAGCDRTVLSFAAAEPTVMISLQDREKVEVSDLALDGNSNPKATQGISAGNARRLDLHDLAVRNLVKGGGFGPHGILFSGTNPTGKAGATDSRIADCLLENIGVGAEFGGGIRLAWGSSRNQVLRNVIRNTGRGGIFADNGSTDLIIRSNTVTGSGGEGLGIEVWGGCERAVIEDNRIDHWLSFGGCDYGAARRNVISDKSGEYKFCGIEAIGSYLVITDNLVDGGQRIGLSVSGPQPKRYCFWARNTVRECNQWGAQLQGESGGIAYHYFYRCRFLAMPVGHGPVWYPGDEGHGFRTNGDVRHLTLEECEFSENGRLGLQLGGAGVDAFCFRGCTIRNNKGPAVSGPRGYSALEWFGCTVEGNADNRLATGKEFSHPPPVVAFELPEAVRSGEPIAPIDKSRAAHGRITALLWDFGDGVPMTEPQPRHIYERPGKYKLTLIAWDEAGRAGRAEKDIVVRP